MWWTVVESTWLMYVVTGVPQGCVSGTLLFLPYTWALFTILKNKFIGYVDGSTLIAAVSSPVVRVAVEKSLNRDLRNFSEPCDLFGDAWYLAKVPGCI